MFATVNGYQDQKLHSIIDWNWKNRRHKIDDVIFLVKCCPLSVSHLFSLSFHVRNENRNKRNLSEIRKKSGLKNNPRTQPPPETPKLKTELLDNMAPSQDFMVSDTFCASLRFCQTSTFESFKFCDA